MIGLRQPRHQRQQRIMVAVRKGFYLKNPNIASLVYGMRKPHSLSRREKKWIKCFQWFIEQEYARYHQAMRRAKVAVLGEYDDDDDYLYEPHVRGTIRDYHRALLQQEAIS